MRSSPRRAPLGLTGVLGRRVLPGGLAAGGLVPAVVSARALCAAGSLLLSLFRVPWRACGRGGGGRGDGPGVWGSVSVG